MALNVVTFRQVHQLHRPLCISLVGNHRMVAGNHADLNEKCKKIGVVITKCEKGHHLHPMVALLGWNSAQDKHLAKYSEVFEKKGFDTIRISAKPLNTFLLLENVKKISLQLLDILEEMDNGQKRPMMFHVFSMGGFNSLFFIHEAIATPGRHYNSINIIGTIFDSCPHFPGLHSLKGVQSTIVETINNPLVKLSAWIGLALVVPPAFTLSRHIRRLIPESLAWPARCPELYLFCRTDSLVDDKNVEKFIEARKKRGVTVFSICWAVSGHVQHFKNYPEEYLKELDTFTDYCLMHYFKHNKLRAKY